MRASVVGNIPVEVRAGPPKLGASSRLLLALVLLFLGLLEVLMLLEPRSTFVSVVLQERGPVESAQFVLFILVAVFAFQAAGTDRRPGFPACWRGVGVLGIIGAGEESDWGNLTRQIRSVREGGFDLNMMNLHNTIEDFMEGQAWLIAGLALMGVSIVMVIYLLLLRPLIRSNQLWPLLGRSSGRLSMAGIALFFLSQFFDVGLLPAVTRRNPYVDFWDEGFELLAVTCLVLAIVEERRWMAHETGEGA